MNRSVLNNALISMGYRKLNGNTYGKPVGFCISIVIIDKEITFKSMFSKFNNPEEKLLWNSYTMDIDYEDEDKLTRSELYELYCKDIAYAEIEVGIGKAMETGSKKETFAFLINTDIMLTI